MPRNLYQAVIRGMRAIVVVSGGVLKRFNFASQSIRGSRCKTFSASLSDLLGFLDFESLTLSAMRDLRWR